jgi:hypothetical protein
MQACLKSIAVFTAIILAGSLCLEVRGATATANSFSDAFVTTGPTGNLSNSNYGGGGALSVAAPGLSKGEAQTVLQFNLSSVSSSFNALYGTGLWTVQSVTLQLNATPNGNPATFNTTAAGQFNVSLMLNNSWTEGTGNPNKPTADGITFNTLQSTYINNTADQALGGFSFNGATSGAATYSLTLSSGIVADLLSGNDASLRLYAGDTSVSYLFNSRTGTAAPELIINAIPEPGSLSIGAMALAAGVIARRIRSRRQ